MVSKSRQEIIEEIKIFLKEDFGEPQKKKGLPRSIDIHCNKDGQDYYFCVMAISPDENGNYFDATVSSEWDFLRGIDGVARNVIYVIYRKEIQNPEKRIVLLTPRQVLARSIPHLTTFQLKFQASSKDLDNPHTISEEGKISEEALYSAIDDFQAINKRFN